MDRSERPHDLTANVISAGLSIAAALILLFIAVAGTSTLTTFVIILSIAIVAFHSITRPDLTRFAVLLIVVSFLALTILLTRERAGGPLHIASVLVRFLATASFVAYFGAKISFISQSLYFRMEALTRKLNSSLIELEKAVKRLNSLVGVITVIGTKTSLSEIFDVGLSEARKVFKADSGLIYRADEASGTLIIEGSFGYEQDILEKMKRKPTTITSCLACRKRSPEIVNDLSIEKKCGALAPVSSGSSICLPIVSGEKLWGVLHIRKSQPLGFSADDIQLARAIAYHFAVAMERAELFEQITALAITDPMTGLYNFRKLKRDLQRELIRSERYGRLFSFIMIDIDDFKDYNDTYGHQAGDELLKRLGRLFEESCRKSDRVYRYGGEEFAILLLETGKKEASMVAEKIRRNVQSLYEGATQKSVRRVVTVSAGVASYPKDSSTVEGIIKCADLALYRAKKLGKNKIVPWGFAEKEVESANGWPSSLPPEDPSVWPSE